MDFPIIDGQAYQDAWADLYRACYPGLLAFIEARMPEPAFCDATDYASDVFHRLVREEDQHDFKTYDELVGYLEAVAVEVMDRWSRAI